MNYSNPLGNGFACRQSALNVLRDRIASTERQLEDMKALHAFLEAAKLNEADERADAALWDFFVTSRR